MKPIRIQRKRTSGWNSPKNTVYVGRPTKWGNPHSVCEKNYKGYQMAVALFIASLRAVNRRKENAAYIEMAKKELKGRNLMCWCPLDMPCHGDVLLEIANS